MASTEVHSIATKFIDDKSDVLAELSNNIWSNPELNFTETYAHQLLTDFLEENGFKVQRNYHLPTAFKAEYTSPKGNGDVTVAIMCEYDALPEIGHACGHNLIAEAGVGAALGVKAALEAGKGLAGRVVVLGTPAEEGGGGKVILLRAGAFDDVNFSMMVHPGPKDYWAPVSLAIANVKITYLGREAHAAGAPWEGINALDAAVSCYNNISQLRQQMKPEWRVHGIITEGGVKANITPARASLEYLVRASNRDELEVLKCSVTRCFEAAALSSNCHVSSQWNEDAAYDELNANLPMARTYKKHAEELGVVFDEDGHRMGSTDAGNVSKKIPSIHPLFFIPAGGINHTREFSATAGSPTAQPPTLIAAKSMALTTLDLFADPKLRNEALAAFEETMLDEKKN